MKEKRKTNKKGRRKQCENKSKNNYNGQTALTPETPEMLKSGDNNLLKQRQAN